MYKVHICDRTYSNWKFYNVENFPEEVYFDINPLQERLFSNDQFNIDSNKKVNLQYSTVRTNSNIAGVLLLKANKTYGRDKRNNKLLYKVVPDDKRIPTFLVPYEIKKIGFSKVFSNLYVTVAFNEWTDKHPIGILNQVIGPVDNLENFYEYQLYCKNLNSSIQKFTKDASNAIKSQFSNNVLSVDNIMQKYPSIQDRRNINEWSIITIDPEHSLDYDDGVSLKKTTFINSEKKEMDCHVLSIYISNVTVWIDVLNLWDSFSRRISTIYLPDRNRTMLPSILSDNLCSLFEKQLRFAFCMDITFSGDDYTDPVVKFFNALNSCLSKPK
jgi:exoribonuclease R